MASVSSAMSCSKGAFVLRTLLVLCRIIQLRLKCRYESILCCFSPVPFVIVCYSPAICLLLCRSKSGLKLSMIPSPFFGGHTALIYFVSHCLNPIPFVSPSLHSTVVPSHITECAYYYRHRLLFCSMSNRYSSSLLTAKSKLVISR